MLGGEWMNGWMVKDKDKTFDTYLCVHATVVLVVITSGEANVPLLTPRRGPGVANGPVLLLTLVTVPVIAHSVTDESNRMVDDLQRDS